MNQVTYSRGELYERYRKKDYEKAKKFLPARYEKFGATLISPTEIKGATAFLASFLACVALALAFFIAAEAFRFNPPVYTFATLSTMAGISTVASLISIAIGYCKRKIHLAEKLTVPQIIYIAGKQLPGLTPDHYSL